MAAIPPSRTQEVEALKISAMTTTKGSCLCGKLTYEFTGSPLTTVSNLTNPPLPSPPTSPNPD